jgi:hypothetical protein
LKRSATTASANTFSKSILRPHFLSRYGGKTNVHNPPEKRRRTLTTPAAISSSGAVGSRTPSSASSSTTTKSFSSTSMYRSKYQSKAPPALAPSFITSSARGTHLSSTGVSHSRLADPVANSKFSSQKTLQSSSSSSTSSSSTSVGLRTSALTSDIIPQQDGNNKWEKILYQLQSTGVIIDGGRKEYAAILKELELASICQNVEKDDDETMTLSSSENIKTEICVKVPEWTTTLDDLNNKIINLQVETASCLADLCMSFRPDLVDQVCLHDDTIQREIKEIQELTEVMNQL